MILADDLRKAVLQAAIQGKLTQRMSSDSDVDALLKKIHEEKAILAEKKNARKDKEFGKISEAEIEFDIPDSWRWIRVGDIGVYKKGPFGSSLTKSMFVPKGPNSVKVYEQKNAIQKDASLGEYYITREYYDEKMSGFRVESGDIIVSCAGTIGETYVMPENIEFGIINQALMRMNIAESINLDYFLYYFDHVLKSNAKKSSNGSAIKNIPPFDVFKKMLFPVPPIEEQQRIVEKLNHILLEIDEYSSAEQELIVLQSAFPDDMRRSILQYAMQGKLVEQRQEEGTGEELIQYAQKECLDGKRYKSKGIVTDEEITFDIPDNWTWTRLSEIVTDNTLNDGDWVLSSDMVSDGDVKLIQLGSIGNLEYINKGFKYLTEDHFRELKGKQIYPGYLLVNRLIGDRMLDCIVPKVDGVLMTAVDVCWIAPNPKVYDIKYIMYALASGDYQSKVKALGRGTTRFRISKINLINIAFPLPPLAEQHRIVEKLERILPYTEGLKEVI